ncbi:NAD(+) synthase [bacterium]|nr:NAD(+) synthase [bacterium]|tara:strand:+ start:25944 stop:26750 length:807 start_codon:yes stop_codon:yes gene_type:complete
MNYQKLSLDIACWIKDYCSDNEIQSLVVGVSGGVDSAVASTLAAATGISTYALSIPIRQNQKQLSLAKIHLEWLSEKYPNVQVMELDLTAPFESFIASLSPDPIGKFSNLHAEANTRSRLRMTCLYHIAAIKSGIVVGTGNKIEDYGIGFYTKYGDGGVDIAPIADLYKSEVWDLAKFFGINQSIIDAPPTDGLWDDSRTDEDQIGASYKDLEWVMKTGLKKYESNKSSLAAKEIKLIEKYLDFNFKNSHKMKNIPVYKNKGAFKEKD